jgi:uncharacterized membrane protein YciS (DUF1049 family)
MMNMNKLKWLKISMLTIFFVYLIILMLGNGFIIGFLLLCIFYFKLFSSTMKEIRNSK